MTKLSIELFDPQLLMETAILFDDECSFEMDDLDDDLEDFDSGISEMSINDFERTLK